MPMQVIVACRCLPNNCLTGSQISHDPCHNCSLWTTVFSVRQYRQQETGFTVTRKCQ